MCGGQQKSAAPTRHLDFHWVPLHACRNPTTDNPKKKKHDSSDSKQELAPKRDNGPQNTREECALT